ISIAAQSRAVTRNIVTTRITRGTASPTVSHPLRAPRCTHLGEQPVRLAQLAPAGSLVFKEVRQRRPLGVPLSGSGRPSATGGRRPACSGIGSTSATAVGRVRQRGARGPGGARGERDGPGASGCAGHHAGHGPANGAGGGAGRDGNRTVSAT